MASIALFILAAIGLTNIMVHSTIMEPLRCKLKCILPEKVYEVFECYQCMGTWCGFVCGALILCRHPVADILLFGFAGSFAGSFMRLIWDYIQLQIDTTAIELELPEESKENDE